MKTKVPKMIELECDNCKCKYKIKLELHKKRIKSNRPNLCKVCMKEYANKKRKEWHDNLSEEDKLKYAQVRKDSYDNKSPEEKVAYSQRTKDQLAKRTPEEWKIIKKKNSEGLTKHWKSVKKKDKDKRIKPMHEARKQQISEMSPEERQQLGYNWMKNKTEEEIQEILTAASQRMKEYNDSLSLVEKQRRAENMQRWHENLTPEQKKELYEQTHQWYYELSEEDKINYAISKRDWYENLSDEDKLTISKYQIDRWNNLPIQTKAAITKKTLSASGKINNFNKRFEDAFNSSHLVNNYHIISELMMYNETAHSWDYGIYDKTTNELVMVVDLDGAYFHADECDYDGFHSQEECDEKRILSIPTNSNIKHFIIQEMNFKKCFELMIKTLMMNYDEYVDSMFKYFRSMPFPSPRYTDNELIKAYHKLEIMKTDDKYHKNISLNTRNGDRLITHFHESIYMAKRKGSISPYDAWYNDKLLRECIKNRIIYQNHLNSNKILQGFNISRVAMKVSVFSAGRAKMLISRYLSDCNEIFDPFSGFSGRMLGTISLNKKYIGQDISEIHVRESNNMLKFLYEYANNYDIRIDATINQANILDSYGTYECLFTCPPYEDIEQWLDVPLNTRTCDDWIDECLSRFKCKKYLFVVDYTEKYISNVVNEIINRSHFNNNSEYVVLIER